MGHEMEADLEVPKVTMSNKYFTCPACNATVSCYVDIYAKHFEDVPEAMELHLRWHERNNHVWIEDFAP